MSAPQAPHAVMLAELRRLRRQLKEASSRAADWRAEAARLSAELDAARAEAETLRRVARKRCAP